MIRRDLTGERFGSLTVIKPLDKRINQCVIWECICDCGNIHGVSTNNLTSGHTKSCGCKHHPGTHRDSKSRLYVIYRGMKRRCYDTKSPSYANYGDRNITVCEEWLNSYEVFKEWAVANGYNDSLTIERMDNDKGYCPDNCTWVSRADQNRNQQNTVKINIDGETVTCQMLADALGLSHGTIYNRYMDGVRGLDLIRLEKRRKNGRILEINNEIYHSIKELSQKTGLPYSTLKERFKNGDRGERLTRPVKPTHGRGKHTHNE